jgi:Fic family protein
MHAILLKGARGADKEPGEFRRSQNWIGGSRPGNARYVPPPAHEVLPAMGALEKFIHDKPHRVSPLLKAGLAHVQFESIHPFLDGNGRLGRLLIALVLANDKVLARPLLYLSLYFKENREAYYEKLQDVRRNGDWENWLVFYLTGVAEVADQAALTVRRASALFAKHREKIRSLGRAGFTAERVHGLLERRVVATASRAAKELRLSFPAAAKALRNLKAIGVTREITGKGPAKIYVYQPYLDILSRGTENPF